MAEPTVTGIVDVIKREIKPEITEELATEGYLVAGDPGVYVTLDEAIGAVAVGNTFYCIDTSIVLAGGGTNSGGLRRACQRTDTSPFYVHLGTAADPSSKADVDSKADAAETSAALSAVNDALETQTRTGDAYWNAVFAPPSDSNDIPTITCATSSQISGGTIVSPTNDFYYDSVFRYDGCWAENLSSIASGTAVRSAFYGYIQPEIVTDAQDIEFVWMCGRTDSLAASIRVIVDGKWCQVQMLRFPGTRSVKNYYRLQFPTSKVRRIKVEQEGNNDFYGLVIGTNTVLRRPERDYRMTVVAIGDSLTAGGVYGDVSGRYFYNRMESHSRFQAALMGADRYINLGVGGSGWSSVKPEDTFGNRIQYLLAARPQVAMFLGSRNDNLYASEVPAALLAGLSLVREVPVVLLCGAQQAGTYNGVGELVRQGTESQYRTWLNIDGLIAAPSSNPTGHPTFEEQIALAKAAHANTDLWKINSKADAAFNARPAPSVTVSGLPTAPVASGVSQTFTATVSPAYAGSVQFYVDGVAAGSKQALSGGTASYSAVLADGAHRVMARFLPTDPLTYRSALSAALVATVSANPGFTDDFNRADGALGNTLNGKAWDTTYSGWVVTSNQAGRTTASSTGYTTADSELANGVFTVTMSGTFSKNAGLVFRYSSGSNFLRLDWLGGSNNPRLDANVNNVSTGAVVGTGGAWTAGDVIEVTLNESAVTVKKNGVGIVSGTFTQGQSNTRAGFIGASASTAVRFDDVSFVAL